MNVFRNPESLNAAASDVLKNIMRTGVRTESYHPRFGNIITYQVEGGFGARWYLSGEFIGFINP